MLIVGAILAATSVCSDVSAQDATFTFTRVGGDTFEGTLQGISEDGILTGEGLPDGLSLESLREIRSDASVSGEDPQVIVHLAGGDLYADSVSLEGDDQCKVRSQIGTFDLGLGSILAVRLVPDKPLEAFDKAITKPLEASDQIFIELDGTYQRLEGLLEKIDQTSISFEYEGESRKLPTSRIYGFVLAAIEDNSERKVNAKILLRNGSNFAGKIKSMNDGTLVVNAGLFADLSIPISAVSRIGIRSSRLAFLSDLDPVEAEQTSLIVAVERPWQRDRSIELNPLTLFAESGTVEKVFSKGLGTHSGCRLVFENKDQFNRFAATIGIDAETNRNGDCLFVVLGDGRELLSERVKGTDDARDISVDITGVQEVTLQVLPGENLDLADHADWCDARFLKADK